MPDGDVFQIGGRNDWKTAAYKLVRDKPGFERSIVWAIQKMFRDGNFSAMDDLTYVIASTLHLQVHGVESRVQSSRELDRVAHQHFDADSQTAVRLARALLQDEECLSDLRQASDSERPLRIAHELLARLSHANLQLDEIESLLRAQPQKFRDRPDRVRLARRRGLEVVRELKSVRDLAGSRLHSHELPNAPAVISEPSTPQVDQHSIISHSFDELAAMER